ncbi:MAG: efflux RND transporter periplasmic adaptor subunit [Planctomycetales bacterium]|nr:efflux RND transporter periplasmic adaptor subunit [Planctomycetales bacterium]
MQFWHRRVDRRRAWALSALAAAIFACGCREQAKTPPSQPSASPSGPRQVVALGRLDPTGGVISISAIPGERLESFASGVEEGADVQSGQVLGQLASYSMRAKQAAAIFTRLELSRSQRMHETAVAIAQVEQARAARAQALAKLEEVKAQRLSLSNLGEAAAIAREDLERLRILRETDPELVTDHQLRRQANLTDRAENEYKAADSAYPHALRAAEMAVEAAEANLRLAEQSQGHLETVDTTVAIEKELEVAQESLQQSQLKAPADALPRTYRVVKTIIQAGEFVTQMPVLQVADLSSMACIAEVYEADVKEISEGQRVTIYSQAFAAPFDERGIEGRVERIGALVSNPDLASRNPLAPVDRSVVEVVIAIDPNDQDATRQAARWIGMEVTVEFAEREARTTSAAATSGSPAPATPELVGPGG